MKYESPITYHSKDMASVKVFINRQTGGQAKNYMPPIFQFGGIKKNQTYLQTHLQKCGSELIKQKYFQWWPNEYYVHALISG
jgi:hypothetical protein